MNGISSTLKDEIKKSKDGKQKEKFKFVAAIVVTNIMVALLCMPSKEVVVAKVENIKISHAGYQVMTVPLSVLVSEASQALPENPVTLISKDKKIIAEKAYLHEASNTPKTLGEAPHFKIEISNTDIVRVSEFAGDGMVAVPYVEIKKPKVHSPNKGSRYEVSI